MRTDDLIAHLASQALPVRPLAPPARRAAGWCALAVACAGAGVLLYGVRPNVAVLLLQPVFLGTAVLAIATMVVAVSAALVLAIPAAERSSALRVSSVALLILWAGVTIVDVLLSGRGLSDRSDWYICLIRVMSIGLVPGLVILGMLRRAAPLRPAWTTSLAAAATMAAGALAIQFICPVTDPGHALLGHFGPVALLSALGASMARWVLGGAASVSPAPFAATPVAK